MSTAGIKNNVGPRAIEGRYVGTRARTGELMIMTSEGILVRRNCQRPCEEQRRNVDEIALLKAPRLDLRPVTREPLVRGPAHAAGEAMARLPL